MNSSDHKQALFDMISTGNNTPGILAYVDDYPVGWNALGPREDFTRLFKSSFIRSPDDQAVWSIVCFFIHKKFRNSGITKILLVPAENYAKSQGALILESYPVETHDKIPPEYAYCSVHQLFSESGFTRISTTKATSGGIKRILMRKTL